MILVYVTKVVGGAAIFAAWELFMQGDCWVALAAALPLSLAWYATRMRAARRRAQGGRN